MIKKIQISDASIAEEIRKQMAVATIEEKGLATKGMGGSTYKKEYTLSPGESVDITSRYSIVILTYSPSGSCLCFLHANNYESIAQTGSMFSFLNEVDNKISVISKGEVGFSIKNNAKYQVTIHTLLLKTQP